MNNKISDELLKRVILAYSSYLPIKELYDKNNILINSDINFHDLPLISKKHLSAYPLNRLFAVPLNKLERIYTTSGTTSKPHYVGYTKNDWEEITDILCDCFHQMGIGEGDFFYDAIPKSTIMGGYVALEAAKKTGATVIAAGKNDLENHIELINDIHPTVLNGISFFIIKIGHELDLSVRENVKIICLVGEVVLDSVRKQVKDLYPNADIFSGYGISEIGTSGECKAKKGFHFNPKKIFLEIDNPNLENIGDVIYTSLFSEAMPLIRYNSGDRGRIIYDKCECGCEWPRVEIFGRQDEMTKIRGKLVSLTALKEVIYSEKNCSIAFCQYYPNENGKFELIYDGEIDEESLRNLIKCKFDITPCLIKKKGLHQWKTKFFTEIH